MPMTFTGIELKDSGNSLEMSQTDYAHSINELPIEAASDACLNSHDATLFGGAMGKLQ